MIFTPKDKLRLIKVIDSTQQLTPAEKIRFIQNIKLSGRKEKFK